MGCNRHLSLWLSVISLLILSLTAQAEEWIQPGTEKLIFVGGVFLPEIDTKLRVNYSGHDGGLPIDIEDQFRLTSRKSTGYIEGRWRIFDNHRFSLAWFQLDRDASATATQDIEIGDGEIIQAGAEMYTRLNMDIIPFSYAYSFIRNDTHELAGYLGVHWANVDFFIDASAWAQDQGGKGTISAKADAPMPLVGIDYRYYFSPRWTAGLNVGYFQLSLSDDTSAFSGNLYNFRADTEYWFWEHVGFGAALNASGLNVDVNDDAWHGSLDYVYWGPQLYVKARF